MDFALSNEQRMLQESARRFFAERHPLSRARRALPWADEAQRGLWRDMADMGWLGLLAAEKQGGLELGMCEAFLVSEAAGRQLLNLPFASSAVLLPLLFRASAQQDSKLAHWIGEVVAGRAAINVTFDGMLFMDHDLQCSDQWLVRGFRDGKTGITLTQLLRASVDESQFLAEPAGLDPSLRSARMVLGAIPADSGLALVSDGLNMTERDRAFALACYRMARIGELLGAAGASLDLSCDYARQREQFGKPIGSYQAVKHHLANAWMALDNARLAALYAVASLDDVLPDWPFACAAAELTAIEGSLRIGRNAIQIHGGLGFTWEHDAHLYLKRIHHVCAMLGGADAAYEALELAI